MLTLEELERDAYQRGDVEAAEIIAMALDAEEQQREHDEIVADLERRIEDMDREREDRRSDARAAVLRLRDELEAAQRMGNRAAIMEALAELEECI